MKRDTSVGKSLKEGDSFFIFAVTPTGRITMFDFNIDLAELEGSMYDDVITRWWKFSIKDRMDCVHFAIAVTLAGADANFINNVVGELAIQYEEIAMFMKERNLTHRVDGSFFEVFEVGKGDVNAADPIGLGETMFEALVSWFRRAAKEAQELLQTAE